MSNDKNILEVIESMRRLYNDIMREYNELVLPWGLGYNIPEVVSGKATEILEHAARIFERIEAMESEIGIETKRNIPVPNARPVCDKELYWRVTGFTDLLEAVACRMCWSQAKLNDCILDMGEDWLAQYAPEQKDLAITQQFWLFLCARIQVVLARVMAEADDKIDESAFRRIVRQRMRSYLFTTETYTAFGYKFLAK